jgi:hypothetical protein
MGRDLAEHVALLLILATSLDRDKRQTYRVQLNMNVFAFVARKVFSKAYLLIATKPLEAYLHQLAMTCKALLTFTQDFAKVAIFAQTLNQKLTAIIHTTPILMTYAATNFVKRVLFVRH